MTEPTTALMTRLTQNHHFLPLKAGAERVCSAPRLLTDWKKGVASRAMAQLMANITKPTMPTTLNTVFHCQIWLVAGMGLGAPRACSKNSMVEVVERAEKWDQGWMMLLV